MKQNTYVISLADEEQRRENIKNQLLKIDYKFEFIDAEDLRKVDESYLSNRMVISSQTKHNRALTRGEVGCSFSHFKCYQKIIHDNVDWAWVLEDDANLQRLGNNDLQNLISMINNTDVDVVILGYSKLSEKEERLFYKFEPIKKMMKSSKFSLGKPWRNWTCGTVSYLISQSGARKMLSTFNDEKVITVADDWNFFEKQANLNILHCRPILVLEDFVNFNSTLEAERELVSKKKRSFLNPVRVLRGYMRALLMRFL